MVESKSCLHCAVEFEPRRKDQKYCSRTCKDRAKSVQTRAATAGLPCIVDGCGRQAIGKKYCSTHYRRIRTSGELGPAGKVRGGRFGVIPCAVEGCNGTYYAKDLCRLHYSRQRLTGSAGVPGLMKRAAGEGCYTDDKGYRKVVYQAGGRTRKIFEHRLVMEQMLGRPLQAFENVHHRNGRRSDNDPSNLELWTRPQPRGQRPEDLVAWVVEFYPDLVADALARMNSPRSGNPCQ